MSYKLLSDHYKNCFKMHGDCAKGMGWPNEDDNTLRFDILTNIFEQYLSDERKLKILDFACGTSAYFEYLQKRNLTNNISYTGIDIVDKFVSTSQEKFPGNRYLCADILASDWIEFNEEFDFIIVNGLFTQKLGMKDLEMYNFWKKTILKLNTMTRSGLAFNTMSQFCDYKLDQAFHIDWVKASKFIRKNISQNFTLRNDYRLYETTFYVYL